MLCVIFVLCLSFHPAIIIGGKLKTDDPADSETDTKPCTSTPGVNEARATATARTDPVTHRKVYDLVYIVDESWSVEQEGFDLEKKFLKIFTEKFSIRPDYSQTCFIKFSWTPTVEWDFDNFVNQDSAGVIKRISGVQYSGGGTAIAQPLQDAKKIIDRSRRPNVVQAILLLTDGMDEMKTNPEVVAKQLRDNKVEIFAIAIGSDVDEEQLNKITGDPEGSIELNSQNCPKSPMKSLR